MSSARGVPQAMDFFEHQERARKRTGLLILYFVLAVVAIIVLVYVVVAAAFVASESQGHPARTGLDWSRLWDWQLFAAVTLGTLALVGGGSAYRVASLASGGPAVAEMLGGRPIDPSTSDPDERKVLNVVEEMAIASGVPVPPVYLLDNEPGINAFAAGHRPGDAVIGVTRGCVQTLSRDELQGVMAHEFSHILNGDMRLNIRLMGVLYGILLIGITGWIIFRTTIGSGRYQSRSSDDKKGGNPLPLIGLALYVIGYVGVFFGRLIKASVSRQREYLADASAVQFTRNPGGIAGALKKIGAAQDGSRVRDPEAEEANHMFFGEALGLSGWNPMASHPPLVERIRRIDPAFDGDFSTVSLAAPRSRQLAEEVRRAAVEAAAARVEQAGPGGRRIPFNPVEAVTRIGRLDPANVAYAAALIEAIPAPLVDAAREPFGARALVYALLLDANDAEVRSRQLEQLARDADAPLLDAVRRLAGPAAALPPESRLPLVEIALPALRRLSPEQFRDFVETLRHLMEADRQISLFEYALRRLILRHLAPQFERRPAPVVRYTRLDALDKPLRTLLAALAYVGQDDPEARERAYRAGLDALGVGTGGGAPPMPPASEIDLPAVDRALDVLVAAAPDLKKQILIACATAIGADGRVTAEEGELLRAVSDALDCPMPPLNVSARANA